ncbi:SAM-dependent methyltransferase [Ochrobactrum sp. P6BSIII]|uniref:hypothetical protein n=1 Tax=unclassified Ochrobactrum TaxID=239106 RepID=UPI001793C346|nr:SAM-dependent methyltransferase [Ochrobactrum sp. P6BSIII]
MLNRMRRRALRLISRTRPKTFPTRESIYSIVDSGSGILEIGPFYSPTAMGPNVKYFDVMDQSSLRERAKVHGAPIDKIPNIDFVSPSGDLSIIEENFSKILSSHCIEHQPDLIRHLNQVSKILNEDGIYYLIIPDKRYCFDYAIPHSTLEEVIFAQGDTRHPLLKVIEHRAQTTHNDASRHWNGDHFNDDWKRSQTHRAKAAIAEYEAAAGGYVDVHRWQFTPDVFQNIIMALFERRLINLTVREINQTPVGRFEFTCLLAKS